MTCGRVPETPSTSTTAALHELPRRFGWWTGVFVVVASMVGGGILVTSGEILVHTQSYGVLFALWTLGGVLALCGALTLAELATAIPRAGGEYVYVRRAFGPACGFVYGAATLVLAFAAPIAVIAHATANYLAAAGRSVAATHVLARLTQDELFVPGLASLLIVLFSLLHILGQRESAWLQGVTTLFKLCTLVGIAVAGLCVGDGSLAHLGTGRALEEQRLGVLAVALVQVCYAYSGWNGAAYLAGEIVDPARNLPRSLIGGCLLVTLLYLALNLTYALALDAPAVAALPKDEVQRIAETAVTRLFGPRVGSVLALVIGVGLIASLSAFILTGPRVAFAMARDGLLPATFGCVHRARGTPAVATVLQAVLALLVLWSGTFDAMITYSGAGMLLLAGMVMLAVFPLRRRGELPGAFATPLFPWPPVIYLLLLIGTVAYAAFEAPWPTLLSIGSIALMWPLYALVAHSLRRAAR
jgi:APA family basic amino acid/polyamine antiporter